MELGVLPTGAGTVTPSGEDEATRPWGHYEVLADDAAFKVKSLTVFIEVQHGKSLGTTT